MTTRVGWRSTAALAGALALTVVLAPAAGAADRYSLVHGCYALRTADGRYVAKDALGYAAGRDRSRAATPFRMQATALGRYLLYGPDAHDARGRAARHGPVHRAARAPAPTGRSSRRPAAFTLTALTTGSGLGVGLARPARPRCAAASAARFTLAPTTGCAQFPEIEVNATGTPFKGASPTAPVRGFLDAHTHVSAFEFLGGRFHCGRPWSPYGVTVALQDCADHQPNGAAAVAENFLATGSPVGTHDTHGWPTFAGWPRDESLTHEGTYWKWIERAWRGGLRIMVNDLVENRALCELYPLKQNDCNEMDSVRLQAQDMFAPAGLHRRPVRRARARASSASYQPRRGAAGHQRGQARRGARRGDLGGLDCGQFNGTPLCDAAQIDRGLDELHALGVRSLFPVHKFDNALGGTHFDDGATGVARQRRQQVRDRPVVAGRATATTADPDNEPTNVGRRQRGPARAVRPGARRARCSPGSCPAYPPGPLCNPKGLTALGAHLIQRDDASAG